jgi:glycosyltransferase involved in cell wall biosynthesis
MKICLVGPAHPLRGGIAHYNAQLALELAERHEVALLSFSRQYPALLFPGRSQLDPHQPLHGLAAEPILDSLDPRTWLRAGSRIAELSPDLVVVHWWHPFFALPIGTMVRLARRRSSAGVLIVCHNITPHEPFPGARGLTRFALAPTDVQIVHSDFNRRDLESLGLGGRIAMTPTPPARGFGAAIDKEQARARLGISGPVLLYFGFVRRYKGLTGLFQAMPLVLRELDCTLLVAGEFYEGKAQCLNLIESLGLRSKVLIFDRFIPDDQVGLYFSAADLVVLPYESATQSGIVPIAHAFERPVVATRVGGLPDDIRDGTTGLLVEPHNPTALAEAIVRFYRDRLDETIRHCIRRQRDAFSWGDLVKTIEALHAGSRRTA